MSLQLVRCSSSKWGIYIETQKFILHNKYANYINYAKYTKWVSTHVKYAHLVWVKTNLARWWVTNLIIHSLKILLTANEVCQLFCPLFKAACSDLFNLDLAVQPPPPTLALTPLMFKLFHYEAHAVGKRAVGIILECFLILFVRIKTRNYPNLSTVFGKVDFQKLKFDVQTHSLADLHLPKIKINTGKVW